jgi:putative addiction module component (TIGR02574 family)
MPALAQKILHDALALPSDLRASLADKLLESLNSPAQKKLDLLWAKEAEKRLRDIRTGKASTVPANLVFEEVRRKYGK